MAFDYSKIVNTANSKIEQFGTTGILKSVISSSYNPATGINVPVISNTTIKFIKTAYKSSEIDGSIIKQGDIKLVCSPETEIKVDDTVEISGIEYSVINVEKIEPAGSLIIQKVQVRK